MPQKANNLSQGAEMAQSLALMVIQSPDEYDTFREEWSRISSSFGAAPTKTKALPRRIAEVTTETMSLPEDSRVLTDSPARAQRVTNRERFQAAALEVLQAQAGEWVRPADFWAQVSYKPCNRAKFMSDMINEGVIEKIGTTRDARYRVPTFS